MFLQGWGEGKNRELLLNGDTVSSLQDEKSAGDWMSNNLNTFNIAYCTLKMVKMVNFMLCVFYHHFPKVLPMVNNKAGFTELLLVANLNMT